MNKGRYWIAVWLAFVLVTLVWVVSRQTSSMVLAARSGTLQSTRSTLEASKAEQQARIREATSRSVLVPRAESIGLGFPADSDIVMVELPAGSGADR